MGLSKKFVLIFAVGSLPLMMMYQNCSKTQNLAMEDMTALKADGSLPFDTGNLGPGQSVVLEPGAGTDKNVYQVEPDNSSDSTNGALGAVDESSSSNTDSSSNSSSSSDSNSSSSTESPPANSSSNPEVLADCSLYMKESNNDNGDARYGSDSASGVQGHKVLTPEDFGGNRNIKSISNTGGHIVLCNLEVESYSDSNGRVDLVNSHAVFFNHKGTVKVIGE